MSDSEDNPEKKLHAEPLRKSCLQRGIMEKKMETTILGLYRGYIGIMEEKMEIIV